MKNQQNKIKRSESIKSNLTGLWLMLVVVTGAVAAYVLYFSGTTVTLKAVAVVIWLDAGTRAAKVFLNAK